MFFFCDNSEFASATSVNNDTFCIGGFMAELQQVKLIEKVIDNIKNNHNIPPQLPIKWNMRDDRLSRAYQATLGEARIKQILAHENDTIRQEIFNELDSTEVVVIISAVRKLSQTSKKSVLRVSFRNLLERYGLEIKNGDTANNVNFIVLDWDNDQRNDFCEIYDHAYRKGESYFSGSLGNIGYSLPYLSFSVTQYNPLLQLADLIVGCTADFLRACSRNETQRDEIRKLMQVMLPKFRQSPSGEIFNWGLIIRPADLEHQARDGLLKVVSP
jgi:hypothetical protein